MNIGLRALIEAGGDGRRHVVQLQFDEGPSSPSHDYRPWINENSRELEALATEQTVTLESRQVQMFAVDGRRIGSRSAANIFRASEELTAFTDVILDVSSLPRSIFYPLLAKLLHLQEGVADIAQRPNLFAFAAENAALDSRIVDEGVDEAADYVHLFRSGSERMSTSGEPTVWIPILGEGQAVQLERLYELVNPNEICPLLPSPSLNPRRGDELVVEYRELLFARLRVEPRNILYASERNPFEVYRQIRRTILHYQRALGPLGGCQPVVSSVSTKLLSIGGLLAAYELKQAKVHVGIAHIESQGYRVDDEATARSLASQSTLFGLWLAGESYE
ncbi:MAG: hypothetical protein AB7L71_00415 [Vicinamibacterales bacterium]